MGYTDRGPDGQGEVKICLVADWGDGTKESDPSGGFLYAGTPYSIHLGDTYCRTPSKSGELL